MDNPFVEIETSIRYYGECEDWCELNRFKAKLKSFLTLINDYEDKEKLKPSPNQLHLLTEDEES